MRMLSSSKKKKKKKIMMREKVEGQSLIISRVNLDVGSSIIIAKQNVARVSMHCNSEYIFFLGIYNISLNSKRKQETIYKWRESNHSLCDLKPKKKNRDGNHSP